MKATDISTYHQPTGGSMDNGQHILLVEDDSGISQLVKDLLQSHGFRVMLSRDAVAMDVALSKAEPDLMLLDVMLPGESGVNIARRLFPLRRFPIIMLTAMGEETDRIVGLEVGADDYIVKPFSARELIARIRAVLRRSKGQFLDNFVQSRMYMFQGWTLDGARRNLFDPVGTQVDLTSAEFELLRIFCEHPFQVLSRDHLLTLTQGRTVEAFGRGIDTLVSRLRRKIENDPRDPQLLKTVRTEGYILTVTVSKS